MTGPVPSDAARPDRPLHQAADTDTSRVLRGMVHGADRARHSPRRAGALIEILARGKDEVGPAGPRRHDDLPPLRGSLPAA